MSDKADVTLQRKYYPDVIRFLAANGRVPAFPMSAWPSSVIARLKNRDCWRALHDAWSSEIIKEVASGQYEMKYSSYREVPDEIRMAMGLPEVEPTRVEVFTRFNAGHPRFTLDYHVRHAVHGRLDQLFSRNGPAYVINEDAAVVVDGNVESLLEFIDSGAPSESSVEDRLLYMARAKELAHEAGAYIDSYMQKESLETVDTVSIEPSLVDANEIRINPSLRDRDGKPVRLPPRREAPRSVSHSTGRHRHRQLLTNKAREIYAEIASRPVVSGPDVPRMITNPEAFVPEGIDLSLYSDRVKDLEVLVYNSRPYIHVRKSSGGWLEGAVHIELESVREDRPRSPGQSADSEGPSLSPKTLRNLARQASEAGDEWVLDSEKRWIRVGDRERKFAEAMSAEMVSGAYQPIQGVLKILENLELLEYFKGDPEILEEIRRKHAVPQLDQPEGFNGDLLPHQLFGYRWLASLEGEGLGGLLADDMGLGKTVQVLAHLGRLYHLGQVRPTLIVLPLTLLDNWQREIQRFLGADVVVHRHEGDRSFRMLGLRQGADLVLVSYDTLRRDQLEMAKIDWRGVICDEAQYVKNPTAQRTSVVKALKADHRVALTGTPVENGLLEFWCIMDFVQPGLLGSWADFRGNYERPIVEAEEEERRQLVAKLQHDLSPHYVRRLKEEAAVGLPPREVTRVAVHLSPRQLQEYREIAHQGMTGGQGAALAAIQKLLQLCAKPPSSLGSISIDEQINECPKLKATLSVIGEIRRRGEKVAIFTRFLEVQRLLQDAIHHQFGLFPDCINGTVTGRRQQIIDIFSEKQGFNAIIMSHDVAGVGLNVTAANHVIHYTRPWNPAKENQASDRTHRIGQTKPVTIYLPIVRDERFHTVEARLDDLLREKEGLARDVLVPRKDWEARPEDLFDCLDLDDGPDADSSE